MMWIVLVVAVVALLAFVRLAPSDAARWHQPITATETADGEGSAVRVVQADPDLLSDLDYTMRSLPRTRLLAGSLEEGRLTYVTRSKWMGFPDYTTIEQVGDQVDEQIRLYGRLRFGRSDMGVNAARMDGLLHQVRREGAGG